MKRVLIVGAGFLQTFLIKSCVDLGLYTIAIDQDPRASGFSIAHEYEVIDIVDKERCLDYAKKKRVDAVLTAATDYGVLTTSFIAKELNLIGLDFETAKIIRDKSLVRRKFIEAKVDDFTFFQKIESFIEVDMEQIRNNLPVIVKPVDGSGSKGVSKVSRVEEMEESIVLALENSIEKEVVIEKFIKGKEYGVEIFVKEGNIEMFVVMEKSMTNEPYFAELGHCYPTNPRVNRTLYPLIKKAVDTLNINFGSVNFDVIISPNKKIYIVDIGARMGGNLIYSHIIPLGTGISYAENYILSALGDDSVSFMKKDHNFVCTKIIANLGDDGYISNFFDLEKTSSNHDVLLLTSLVPGKKIKQYRRNIDGEGYIIGVSKDNLEVAKSKAKSALKELHSQIER